MSQEEKQQHLERISRKLNRFCHIFVLTSKPEVTNLLNPDRDETPMIKKYLMYTKTL